MAEDNFLSNNPTFFSEIIPFLSSMNYNLYTINLFTMLIFN